MDPAPPQVPSLSACPMGRGLVLVLADPWLLEGKACVVLWKAKQQQPSPRGHPQPSMGVDTGCC